MWDKSNYVKRHTLKCPVGGEVLGTRQDHEEKFIYCRDCNYTYRWKPIIEKPVTAWKGRKNEKRCGCGLCES